jgi:hypothetical protein
MKGQPIRPMVTLDFRDVEKRLGECKEIAWSVDGKEGGTRKSAVFG